MAHAFVCTINEGRVLPKLALSQTDIPAVQPAKGGVMWRTSKASVLDELSIPKQESIVVRLALSPIQQHALRGIMRAALRGCLEALPDVVALAVYGKCALPPEHDAPLRERQEARIMQLLNRPRMVRHRSHICAAAACAALKRPSQLQQCRLPAPAQQCHRKMQSSTGPQSV